MVIYKIRNTLNSKIYVGQDKNNNPDYYGSGVLIKKAIKKYGKINFKKDILEECHTIDELNKREIYWIKYYNSTDNEIGYNLALGGLGSNGVILDIKSRRKMSNSHKGKKLTEEHKKNIGIATKKRWSNKEYKKKLSNKFKNKKMSDESIKKRLKTFNENIKNGWTSPLKGKKLTEEHKTKISLARKGYKRSDESNKKQSKSKSKSYIAISPEYKTYTFKYSLKIFCEEHNLSINCINKFLNKGVIPEHKRNDAPNTRINCIGWDIKTI
jgi:group I intron endonuclease